MKNHESDIMNRPKCLVILLFVVILGLSNSIISQTPKPTSSTPLPPTDTEETIRVDSDLVTVPVTVMDRDGRYVTNLTKDDFHVFDTGIEQEVAFLEAVETPITVFLLLDTSPSMSGYMLDLSKAANLFLNKLRHDDQFIAAQFCGSYKILHDLALVNDVRRKKHLVLKSCSMTRLYDAVYVTFKKMRKISGRKAIVLFSDGEDSGVSIQYPVQFVTEKDNYKTAKEGDVLIYTIQFEESTRTAFPCKPNDHRCIEAYEGPTRYMENLAAITGGRHLRINQITDLSNAFSTIADELKQQYALGYYPKNKGKPGERREIRVRVNRPGLAVRARESYIVGKPK